MKKESLVKKYYQKAQECINNSSIQIDNENIDNTPKFAGALFRGESKKYPYPNVSGMFRETKSNSWKSMKQMIHDQHYTDGNVPTPLLDVSKNFYISLLFAALDNKNKDGIVYVFYPNSINNDKYHNLPRWSCTDVINLLNIKIPVNQTEYNYLLDLSNTILKYDDYWFDFKKDYNDNTKYFYEKVKRSTIMLYEALYISNELERNNIIRSFDNDIKAYIELNEMLQKTKKMLQSLSGNERANRLVKYAVNTAMLPLPIESTTSDSKSNERIKRQSGEFYFQPFHDQMCAKDISKIMNGLVIDKIEVKSEDKKQILKELKKMGITESYIYDRN